MNQVRAGSPGRSPQSTSAQSPRVPLGSCGDPAGVRGRAWPQDDTTRYACACEPPSQIWWIKIRCAFCRPWGRADSHPASLRRDDEDAEVAAGDSLRDDTLPDLRADAVLCNPPFNDRSWGYEELMGDPRWEYGLPPRGEPELAWVQRALTARRSTQLWCRLPGPGTARGGAAPYGRARRRRGAPGVGRTWRREPVAGK